MPDFLPRLLEPMHILSPSGLIVLASTAIPLLAQNAPPLREQEVRIVHSEGAPAFSGTLTTPVGPGPHPAVLLVSPAGEHPRDELRSGGRHLADLAMRLALHGFATLRVDNRGIGGSRNEAWTEWSYELSLEEQAADLSAHWTWLRERSEIDRHRVGVIAHGDGTLAAAQMAVDSVPAFVVLLSCSGGRRFEDIANLQAASLPADLPADRRAVIAEQLSNALEQLVETGPTAETKAALGAGFEVLGLPAEAAVQQATAFAESYGTRWHREYLGFHPSATLGAITCPALVILADDDERLDPAASRTAIEGAFRSATAFNAGVINVTAGGHFLEPGDDRMVLRDNVVNLIRRFATNSTGFLVADELPTGTANPAPLAITGVTVVDVAEGRLRPEQTVIVRDGIIAEVTDTRSASLPAGIRVVEGSGKFLIPGLWDCHVHLSMWGPDALARMVAHGVTTVRDMGGDVRELLAWRNAVESGELLGPRLLLAGSFLDGDKPNDIYRRFVRTPAEVSDAVTDLTEAGMDFLKVHSMLPPVVLRELARVAKERSISFYGHVPVGLTPLAASDIGLRSIEHADSFFSAMARAEPTPAPGWVEAREWWKGADGRAAIERIAANGTFVVPTLSIVSHGERFVGGLFATIGPWTREITKTLHEAGIPLATGTDSSRRITLGLEPGVSLHEELTLLVTASLTPAEALRAATLTPAQMMGVEGSHGEIAVGRVADMVLLSEDPLVDIANTRNIAGVLLRGAWLPRADLDRVLADVQALRQR